MRAPWSILRWALAGAALLCGTLGIGSNTKAIDAPASKVALIVGNSKYISADPLTNPANDAVGVAEALEKIGFKVILKTDVSRGDFDDALADFDTQAQKADVSLFYFAGHGVQLKGQNYLLPIDTKLVNANYIQHGAIPMGDVISAANEAHKAKIIILDACRNNVSSKGGAGSRSLPEIVATSGFAAISEVSNADGMIIFYSAEPGKEALDGDGAKNSPFAGSLIKHLGENNLRITDIFHQVEHEVYESTNKAQHPEIAKDETGGVDIILNPAETADQVWHRIHKSDDPAVFRKFMHDFPDSDLADAAQGILDKMDNARREAESEKKKAEAEKLAAAAKEDADEVARKHAQQMAREQRARAEKEEAEKALAEQAAQKEAERKALEAQRAEEKRIEDQRKAEEQAKLDAERAAKDAEVKRLAEEAAARKREAEQADVARKEAAREEAERAAKEAAEAKRLQDEQLRADAERKKREADAAAKAVADACARDMTDLTKLKADRNIEGVQSLRARSTCPALPAAADQATKDIAVYQAQQCANEQKTLAHLDQKNEGALKMAREGMKCDAVRDAASALIAKLDAEAERMARACVDERAKLVAIDPEVPAARDDLTSLQAKVECPAVRADIAAVVADIDKRVDDAQDELRRLGCFKGKASHRFDAATVDAVVQYLTARHASSNAPTISRGLIDELIDQDVEICAPPAPVTASLPSTPEPVVPVAPTPAKIPATATVAPTAPTPAATPKIAPPSAAVAPTTPIIEKPTAPKRKFVEPSAKKERPVIRQSDVEAPAPVHHVAAAAPAPRAAPAARAPASPAAPAHSSGGGGAATPAYIPTF